MGGYNKPTIYLKFTYMSTQLRPRINVTYKSDLRVIASMSVILLT